MKGYSVLQKMLLDSGMDFLFSLILSTNFHRCLRLSFSKFSLNVHVDVHVFGISIAIVMHMHFVTSTLDAHRWENNVSCVSFSTLIVFRFSNLLEKTTDTVIKAAKVGDLVTVSVALETFAKRPRRTNGFNSIECFQLRDLHTQGYSLLSIDSTGQTALHYGSKYGHKDIVKYLISYAPNSIINMVDNAK